MSKFLNELDARNLLAQHDVPMAKSFLAATEEEATALVSNAQEKGTSLESNPQEKTAVLSFPVVMKVLSSDILHKTEAGCVFVGVSSINEVKTVFQTIMGNGRAYNAQAKIDGVLIQEMAPKGLEVIIGMKKDPQFGPVIMVGTGGIYVEVFKDIALRLLPIHQSDARKMVAETKLFDIINGARGTVYDEEALIDALLRVSDAVEANPSIEEIDINPLFLYEQGKGAKGVDALIKMI